MLYFYLCPVVTYKTHWGTTTPAGKIYTHRANGEKYTMHRGLGQSVICSLENPSIETMANIAADQECIEWPGLDALWLSEVGATRRKLLTEALSSHGVPTAWIDAQTRAGDVLSIALQLSVLQQQKRAGAIALRAAAPSAELDLVHEIRRQRVKITVQGMRL